MTAAALARPPEIGTQRFPIRIESRYSLVLRLFGVRPGTAFVDLGADLDARFGWSRITTPVSNITRWSIEGPWSPLTAIGVRRRTRLVVKRAAWGGGGWTFRALGAIL